jgi:hypothetical protein
LFLFPFVIAAHLVQYLLSDVSKLKRDLDDLSHVHTGSFAVGGVLETGIASKFTLHEIFEGSKIVLVK